MAISFSLNFWTFPVAVSGNSSTNLTYLGTLNLAIWKKKMYDMVEPEKNPHIANTLLLHI